MRHTFSRSVWGGRLFQRFFVIVLFGSLMVHQSDGRQIDRRRISLINEWIDRIRSAPKGKAVWRVISQKLGENLTTPAHCCKFYNSKLALDINRLVFHLRA